MLALVWLLVVDICTFIIYRIAPILANLILITCGLTATIWFSREWVFASRQPFFLYVFGRALCTALLAFLVIEGQMCAGAFMACSQVATGILATISNTATFTDTRATAAPPAASTAAGSASSARSRPSAASLK